MVRLQFPTEAVPQVPLEEVLTPLPDLDSSVVPEATETDASPPPVNAGRPVFRLAQSRAGPYAFLGTAIGGVAGGAAALLGQGQFFWLPLVLGFVTGWSIGKKAQFEICSDPGCGTLLVPEVAVCPNCGGTVAGSIRHADDRLAAEEDLENRGRKP